MNRRSAGFTIFEMVIVLIMVGILTAGIAPMLLRQHTNTMEEKDRLALENAKQAIINYAISNGGFPDQLTINTTTGALVSPFVYPTGSAGTYPASINLRAVGLMPPASNPSAADFYGVPAFGVNNWGVFGGNSASNYWFHLDVSYRLKSSYINCVNAGTCVPDLAGTADQPLYLTYLNTNTANSAPVAAAHQGGDRVVFCQAVNWLGTRSPLSPPRICRDLATRTVAGTTTQCTDFTGASFVLFSLGNNRVADQENDDRIGAPLETVLKGNRIYENDSRGINNSPGDDHYDDQVMSYPVSSLARDCREKMGVASEVMGCVPGQKYVGSVTNNDTAIRNYSLNGAAAVSVPANSFSIYVNTCHARTVNMVVGTQTTALSAADTNGDGRVDFVITGANSFTFQ